LAPPQIGEDHVQQSANEEDLQQANAVKEATPQTTKEHTPQQAAEGKTHDTPH
jgi:hypothetical protein